MLRNSISSVGGPIMLLAVAQQEDEVPTVRREAIAALVAVLEDDKRKIEVTLSSISKLVPGAVRQAPAPPNSKPPCGRERQAYLGFPTISGDCQVPVSAIVGRSMRLRTYCLTGLK